MCPRRSGSQRGGGSGAEPGGRAPPATMGRPRRKPPHAGGEAGAADPGRPAGGPGRPGAARLLGQGRGHPAGGMALSPPRVTGSPLRRLGSLKDGGPAASSPTPRSPQSPGDIRRAALAELAASERRARSPTGESSSSSSSSKGGAHHPLTWWWATSILPPPSSSSACSSTQRRRGRAAPRPSSRGATSRPRSPGPPSPPLPSPSPPGPAATDRQTGPQSKRMCSRGGARARG